jgi:hypothetical protein
MRFNFRFERRDILLSAIENSLKIALAFTLDGQVHAGFETRTLVRGNEPGNSGTGFVWICLQPSETASGFVESYSCPFDS